MAQLTITIPDAQVPRVLAAFQVVFNDQGGEETAAQFLRRHLIDYVKELVQKGERRAHVAGFEYTDPDVE